MNNYSFEMLNKCIYLSEQKLPGLKMNWDLTPGKKIRLTSTHLEHPTNFLTLFEIIHWLVSSYNLIDVKRILDNTTNQWADSTLRGVSSLKMGADDIKAILAKIKSLGLFSLYNMDRLEEFVLELRNAKVCSVSDCAAFSADLFYALHIEAEGSKTASGHLNLERYSKALRKRMKGVL